LSGPTNGKNAVERRLEVVSAAWGEFASCDEARLLRWHGTREDAAIVEAFFKVEQDENGQFPDLFLPMEIPFDDPEDYFLALRDQIILAYETMREDDESGDEQAGWDCPDFDDRDSGAKVLLDCCVSFHEYYSDIMRHLVLILAPSSISDAEAWREQLTLLLGHQPAENIRFTVIEDEHSPSLEQLAVSYVDAFVTHEMDFNTAGVASELAAEAGGEGPGVDFRNSFIALTTALSGKDEAQARDSSAEALRIAREQNWPQQEVIVHIALGSDCLGRGDVDGALAAYREAGQAAQRATDQEDPAGPPLQVTCRMAEGAGLVSGERWPEAATLYEETAGMATEQGNHVMTLEGWRMAAYSFEQDKKIDEAWRCGQEALEAGALLEDDMRADSTLPYVGQALLRLAEKKPYRDQGDAIRVRMIELAGEGWEPSEEQI